MGYRHWGSLPYLDALRPDPGWRAEYAVIASYSVDLVAVVASLLALAGVDNDRGSGSKVDFADACEKLRGRFRVLAQAGRVALPKKMPVILGIMDQFIREIKSDENRESWHPKVSMVLFRSEASDVKEWRIWIGSRNLTRDISWDTGLVFIGNTNGKGLHIPGVTELASELGRRAGIPELNTTLKREFKVIKWKCPKGTTIEELSLLLPQTKRGLPDQPKGIKNLAVVSPFLDGKILKSLGRWGDHKTRRTLLSVHTEIARLASQKSNPLAGFQDILYLDEPEPDASAPSPIIPGVEEIEVSEDEELESRGLHAKIIYAEHQKGRSLWLGSANLTSRAWDGPNVEVVARLRVDKTTASGLMAFIEMGRTVDISSLPPPPQQDQAVKRLEEARKQVAARWNVYQLRHPKGPQLVAKVFPHPDDPEVAIEVGIWGLELQSWPMGCEVLQFSPISKAQETELVKVRLTLDSHESVWIQCAPMTPPPGEERDRHALAHYLDPRTFLYWIRSLMTDLPKGDGGDEWSDDKSIRPPRGRVPEGPTWWIPTLEEILRTWSRNPETLYMVDRKVSKYLNLIRMHEGNDISKKEKQMLTDFEQTWKIVRQVMLKERT